LVWTVKLSKEAEKELSLFDKPVREKIVAFLERLLLYPSPRSIGKALKGEWSGRWRYSVGDYRIICRIHDEVLVVEAVKIGHRREVYKHR
jgi:mRNA interferase RelE/StbE